MQALHHMKKNNKKDQVEGRIATKPTNNKLWQFLELQTLQTSLWVRMRRRRRRTNDVGLITREERRKVYLWREWRRERGREEERETGHAWHTMQECREYVRENVVSLLFTYFCVRTQLTSPPLLNPSLIHYPITTKTFIVPKLVKFQLPIVPI